MSNHPSSVSSPPIVSPYLAIAVAIIAVSTSSIIIRFAQQWAPSPVIAAYRLSLATLVLTPFALTRNRAEIRQILATRSQTRLALISGILLALHFATWITSLQYTSVASSVVLVTTSPLWVGMLSPIFIKEPLPGTIWIGLAITLVGGAVVGVSDSCQLSQAGLICPSLLTFIQG
jgi:drug/metabolite transporter (DMT)-like permease